MIKSYFYPIFLFLLFNCDSNSKKSESVENETNTTTVPAINYAVKAYYGHDNTLYTEGLLVHKGQLFESSGGTRSEIGISDLATGKFDKKIELNKEVYFGEGIIIFNDKLYQLTYTNQEGFIYDAKTYKLIRKFKYDNVEGWGMTSDSTHIIMSDGTDKLTYWEPTTLKPIKKLTVTENGNSRDKLNELEYINGYIYANIYTENNIVKIDPATGNVVGKIDLASLVFEAKNKNPNADVLNGIAFDYIKNKIYVTGKYWNNIYEIDFKH